MLLEELVKGKLERNESLKVDLHNHGQTGNEFRQKPKGFWNRIKYLLLSEGYDNLSGLLERVASSDLDVLYLTDTVDSHKDNQRFANWTNEEQIQKAIADGWEIEVGDYYVFAAKGQGKNRRVIALGHSKEIEAKEMHFIAAGVKRDSKYEFKKKFSLDEALGKLTDDELTSGEKYHEKLQSVQVDGNFFFPFSTRSLKARKIGKKKKVPVIYCKDGHHPKDIGGMYVSFDPKNIKYDSEKEFRDSINNAVRNKKFGHRFSPVPPWRIFHHAVMMGLNYIFGMYK